MFQTLLDALRSEEYTFGSSEEFLRRSVDSYGEVILQVAACQLWEFVDKHTVRFIQLWGRFSHTGCHSYRNFRYCGRLRLTRHEGVHAAFGSMFQTLYLVFSIQIVQLAGFQSLSRLSDDYVLLADGLA